MESFRFPNKYTVGKLFRSRKNIGKADKDVINQEFTEDIQQLIKQQQSMGLEFKKLAMAEFKTKNGLPYTGFVATEKILANEVLVRIPAGNMLTTKRAFFSPIQAIFVDNPTFYTQRYHFYWDYNILWTFLLYESSLGQKSAFYYMLRTYPKEADYLDLWSESDLVQLEDKALLKKSRYHRVQYDRDYAALASILKKYPQYFPDPKTYSEENARWIYCNIATRLFGYNWEYTALIPFMELINHEYARCYWTTLDEDLTLKQCQEQVGHTFDISQEQYDNMSSASDTDYSGELEEEEYFDF